MKASSISEEWVRDKAALWISFGKPDGEEDNHWTAARHECAAAHKPTAKTSVKAKINQ